MSGPPFKLGIQPNHGTRSRYVLGCRCDDCKRANTEAYHERERRSFEAVAHIAPNPGGRCPGLDRKGCPEKRRLKSRTVGVCAACRKRSVFDGLVDAAPVREHLRKLSEQGVGYKSVADAASVARSTLQRIMTGEKRRIRGQAAARVLQVDAQAVADWGLVPAGETRKLLEELEGEFLTKGRLALELGYSQPALQIGNREHVRARTAHRVRKLYRRVAG